MSHHQSPSKKRAADDSEHDPKKAKESHSPASRTRSKGGSSSAPSSASDGSWTNKTPIAGLAPVSGQNPRYATVSFYLPLQGAAEAIDWYKKVFNAREITRFDSPDHKQVFHAELVIGDTVFMLSEDMNMGAVKNPKAAGAPSVTLCVQVPDVDSTFKLALDCGAKEARKIENHFYGDRSGQVIDPFGHAWNISTTIKEVTHEEMVAAMAAMAAAGGAGGDSEATADGHNGKDK